MSHRATDKVQFICENEHALRQRTDKSKPKKCNFCGSTKIRAVMVEGTKSETAYIGGQPVLKKKVVRKSGKRKGEA